MLDSHQAYLQVADRDGPKLARGRIPEYKPNMNVVYDQNELPQVGALNRGVNLTDDSDRVKAPVGAGSTDFERSHKHYADNEADAIVEENENSSDVRMKATTLRRLQETEYSTPGNTSSEQRRRKMGC